MRPFRRIYGFEWAYVNVWKVQYSIGVEFVICGRLSMSFDWDRA